MAFATENLSGCHHDYAPSPNSTSLEAESSKMSQIYEIADLVISADLAPNNKVGFLGRRRGVPQIIELPKLPTLSENPIDEQHAYFIGSGQGNGLTISSNGYDPVFDRAMVPSQTSQAVFERIGITELDLELGGLRSRIEMESLTIV